MPARTYSKRKSDYFARLKKNFGEYSKVFVVGADNVGSFQMQQVRIALRGKGEIVFGKNTMMRKVLDTFMEENAGHPMGQLKPLMQGNVGLVFTNHPDLNEIKKILVENVVPAPAKAGSVAPVSVVVPKGNTGMDPGQTSFFQALNVATKITRGLIEIINDINLIEVGERVTPGQAALLKRLNIMPFSYGLSIQSVYSDGSVFDAKVLDLTTEMLEAKFMTHVSMLSAVCMEIGYPTLASLPHHISTNFQKIASLALELEYAMPGLDELLAAAGTSGGGGGGGGGDAQEEEKQEEEEEEEEEEVELGGGMFGDDEELTGDY